MSAPLLTFFALFAFGMTWNWMVFWALFPNKRGNAGGVIFNCLLLLAFIAVYLWGSA